MTIPELGHDPRDAPAGDRADLQPHARPARRGQAALPVPVDRLPVARARGRDHPPSRQGLVRRRSPCRSPARSRGCATSDVQKPPGIAEAIDWLAALELLGVEQLDAAAIDRTLGSVLKYGEDQDVGARGRPRAARGRRGVTARARAALHACETVELDLPGARRGVRPPAARRRRAGDGRARRALRGGARRWCEPITRRRLYWTARVRARLRRRAGAGVRRGVPRRCSASRDEPSALRARGPAAGRRRRRTSRPPVEARTERSAGSGPPPRRRRSRRRRRARPARRARARRPRSRSLASDEEVLRGKRFDALEPDELAEIHRLMARLRIATPARRTRRQRAQPPRRPHRPAPHAARQPAHRRRSRSGSRAGAGASSRAGS